MSVNSNPTESQQNKKKLPVSKFFSFIAGVVVTGNEPLLSNISPNPPGVLRILHIFISNCVRTLLDLPLHD
jgi:hypothetical protein